MIDDTINKNATEPENEIIDIKLGFAEKKRFRINGDDNRVLELNVSDLNVFPRLRNSYPKLQQLLAEAQQKVEAIPDDEKMELDNIADALAYIDTEMRNLINSIFDTDVSRVIAPSGNMFDPVDGQYRYEKVIDIVTGLYTNGLNDEFNKVKNKVEKKTSKYTKKSKK